MGEGLVPDTKAEASFFGGRNLVGIDRDEVVRVVERDLWGCPEVWRNQ